MKTIGIPYSKDMILAKLAGRKWQTRRVMVPQPGPFQHLDHDDKRGWHLWWDVRESCGSPDVWQEYASIKPPRGIIGDRQYWQEAFDYGPCGGLNEIYLRFKADNKAMRIPLSNSDFAKAKMWRKVEHGDWRGMPAMFTLKSMSRGSELITDLRIERLQDITREDAIAEGLEINLTGRAFTGDHGKTWWADPRLAYMTLWDSINAARGHSWASNPWVWKYTTEVEAKA